MSSAVIATADLDGENTLCGLLAAHRIAEFFPGLFDGITGRDLPWKGTRVHRRITLACQALTGSKRKSSKATCPPATALSPRWIAPRTSPGSSTFSP